MRLKPSSFWVPAQDSSQSVISPRSDRKSIGKETTKIRSMKCTVLLVFDVSFININYNTFFKI